MIQDLSVIPYNLLNVFYTWKTELVSQFVQDLGLVSQVQKDN
jgi:hypothetical protein